VGGTSEGARRPVVLVHGLVIGGDCLEPTAAGLEPFCPVYVPDLPGYGRSEGPAVPLTLTGLADALAEWIEAAGLKRVHLAANSFGCQIATMLAVRHPAAVDRLVLQGPTVDRAARTLGRQVVRLIRNSRREAPKLGWIMLRDYYRAGLRRIIATVRMALADAIEERLPRIAAPTLIVRGALDPLVPQRWAEELAGLLPHGTLAVLPDAAHTIVFTEPRALVAVMLPFLGIREPGSGRRETAADGPTARAV
jgi:pimeloyl-ACP methyl ester carboxylesterase